MRTRRRQSSDALRKQLDFSERPAKLFGCKGGHILLTQLAHRARTSHRSPAASRVLVHGDTCICTLCGWHSLQQSLVCSNKLAFTRLAVLCACCTQIGKT